MTPGRCSVFALLGCLAVLSFLLQFRHALYGWNLESVNTMQRESPKAVKKSHDDADLGVNGTDKRQEENDGGEMKGNTYVTGGHLRSTAAPVRCACSPRKSFVFIKVHKAGSHNTACILQRFVWSHNLTVVLPQTPNSAVLRSWDLVYRKPPLYPPYDVMLHHLPYNRPRMLKIMRKDTIFFSILRHPLSHLKSVINYFHIDTFLRLRKESPIEDYLSDPKYYLGTMAHKTRNWQSFMMGIPPWYTGHEMKTRDRIEELGNEFEHVMILEFYDESLVLLRRKLCWDFKDILYDKQVRNYRSYSYKNVEIPEKLRENHRVSSDMDYMLYDYFNRTLWKNIAEGGEDFQNELKLFKRVNYEVNLHCDSAENLTSYVVQATEWNEEFVVDQKLCAQLKMARIDWDRRFFKRQGKVPWDRTSDMHVKFIKSAMKRVVRRRQGSPQALRPRFPNVTRRFGVEKKLAPEK